MCIRDRQSADYVLRLLDACDPAAPLPSPDYAPAARPDALAFGPVSYTHLDVYQRQALSRAALILAAMDTGSSFEGMGASREALYGALVEPALLLTTATLALMTGHTSFAAIFSAATPVEVRFTIILLLLGYLLTKIFIVEQGRIPVDDPDVYTSQLLGMSLQITNAFADGYIKSFGDTGIHGAKYLGTFGVEHSTILISLSQISETLCILLIPFFLKRFGIKRVMLIAMFAWVLRFALLGAGNPGPGVWMFILSMIVYGCLLYTSSAPFRLSSFS